MIRMTDFSANSGPRSRIDHQHYSELSALATTGTLTEAEWRELKAHIATCPICSRNLQEYREIARTGMPLLMPERSEEYVKATESWSLETAKQELRQRISRGDEVGYKHQGGSEPEFLGARIRSWLPRTSMQPALLYSAAAVLIAMLCASAYHLGTKSGTKLADFRLQAAASDDALLHRQLHDLANERASLEARLGSSSAQLQLLQPQLIQLRAEVEGWKSRQTKTSLEFQQEVSWASALESSLSSQVAEGDAVSRKLHETQSELQEVQSRYDALRQQHSAELLRAVSLESQIAVLSARLKDAEADVKEHEQFLASDRDVRELMGARELYIADVFDVDPNGEKRRPFGRVFYTTGKSLIFYAFDLDREPQALNPATFQAWGRRGVGDKSPLSLGIFYLENAANRRWVLKFDNPAALAQIDAVFVTVEPHSGSQKPSGKQLLFSSLRMPPNHP